MIDMGLVKEEIERFTSISKSTVSFGADYSAKDFQIDFDEVSHFSTQNLFVINITDNSLHTGTIKSVGPGKL
jgi:hypothetical protein